MDFRILGPLELRKDGRSLACRGAKQRLLLAALLVRANEVVSSDQLIEALWGEHPPPTAAKALQVHISQLRRLLDPDLLVTRPPGYELRLRDDQLDLKIFESRLATARSASAAGRTAEASSLLVEALSLWRGPPLADLTFEDFLQPEIARLAELRLTAIADRIDSDLALGRHAELIAELEGLSSEHPLRERLRGQLMLALYRAGRQAEALEVYADTRRRLVDELGLEPRRELKDLQQRILAQDPELEPVQPVAPEPEVLVGRERELVELSRLIDGATLGRGAIALIGGEPGIGKSRLAEVLARRAAAAGARVAVGRCWEAGGAPAYWPWVQALRVYIRDTEPEALRKQIGPGLPELAALLPELGELIDDHDEKAGDDLEGNRFRVFDSVSLFLRGAATSTPLVLFIDDLHAADVSSLLLLRFVALHAADARLMIVACYRDTEVGPDLAETLAELAREPRVHRFTLHGLDEAATTALLAGVLGADRADAIVARVHGETRGNPLFASEIARLLASGEFAGDASERLPIPEGVREAIRERLRRQSTPCRELLALASVLGREFDLTTLGRVAAVETDQLSRLLEEAAAARVVGNVPGADNRLRFSHILVRDALYEDLPASKRLQLHQRAGEALELLYAGNLAPHLAEIAHHYLQAGPALASKATDYAIRAGDRAASQYGYEDAALHYRSALALLETGGSGDLATTCDVLLSLGESLSRAGDSPEAKDSLRRAADIAETNGWLDRLVRAALAYGGRFAWARASTDPALLPMIERALAAIGDSDDPARARLLARLAAAIRDDPDRTRRLALAEEAVAIARQTDDLVTRAYAVEGYWIASEGPDKLAEGIVVGAELISLGRQIGDREHEFTGRDFRLNAFWKLTDRAGVDVELDVLTRLAEELRQPAWRWWVRTTTTMRTLMEGRLDEAEQMIHQTRSFGERAERWNAHVSERLQLFVLRRAQGRVGELEDVITRSVHEYPTLMRFACALAHLYAELGDRRSARATFDKLLLRDLAHEYRDAEWLFSMALLADPCLFLADEDAAAKLYELLLPYEASYAQAPVEAAFGSGARALGVLATVLGRFDEGERHFEAAVEIERRMRARPWLAHAQHDFAAMLIARGGDGDAERAAQLLGDAVAGYRELDMTSWADRASALI